MDNSQRLDSSTLSKLTPQELKLYKLYGKLPNKKDLLNYKLKDNRKFFDSGDYHMKKEQQKHPLKSENIVPIHNPEQIKVSRRKSSTTSDSSFEEPNFRNNGNSNNEKYNTPSSSSLESNMGNANNMITTNNGVSGSRPRSNSLLNPQQNPNSQSPLSKRD
ncbi:hypothetical protein HANVADRAFT_53341 [Hanseniaspora valbyensis NRRL Y-1626]|uniref:mRNA stability protein n=1 Tax=Hanseniaspora valbyensis NRRL Y-1626 TaxID=766949 RepID=A0A1B7TBR0_9ASCO|nr:hypothetical protein HANVADRAFT_53341 [Hanseniaspora valbyensis NRRL Y-1626]